MFVLSKNIFFIVIFYKLLYTTDISTSTINTGINQSLYDFEFTNKVIDYFQIENKKMDIYELKKMGFYRTELIFTIKFSIEKNIDISEIIKKLKQTKKSIYNLANEHKYDVKENFLKSIKVRKNIESEINELEKLKKIIKKEFLNEN